MNRDWSSPPTRKASSGDFVRVGARAVDVGYFNCKYSTGRKPCPTGSSAIQTGLFPSLAARLAGRSELVSPGAASPSGCVVERAGVRYFVGEGVHSRTTGLDARHVLPNFCLTDEYLALLAGALFYMAIDAGAGDRFVVESLVLGLPLNTHREYAEPLRERVIGEHEVTGADGRQVRILVEEVNVIVQPQGALLNFNYRNRRPLKDITALVLDPGGGTFDWFLYRDGVPNWSRAC